MHVENNVFDKLISVQSDIFQLAQKKLPVEHATLNIKKVLSFNSDTVKKDSVHNAKKCRSWYHFDF